MFLIPACEKQGLRLKVMPPYSKHCKLSKQPSLRLWWPCCRGQSQRERVYQGLGAGKMPALTLGSWAQEEEDD